MSPRARLDFAGVNAAALAALPDLLARWLPGGRREGAEWKARNPKRDDHNPGSFGINLANGKWGDFASGDKGGDPVSLYGFLNDLKPGDAARALAAEIGVDIRPNGDARPTKPKAAPNGAARPKKAEWTPIIPVPEDAPQQRHRYHEHGLPSGVWAYRDAAGRLVGYACRFDYT